MKAIVLFLAAIALCTALPSEADEAYRGAQQTIQELMQQGNDDNACRNLAEATIKEIKLAVVGVQTTFDALDKGFSCIEAGQEALTSAKNKKNTEDQKASAAASASSSACNAKVQFASKPLSQLNGQCNIFWEDAAYLNAKRTCNSKKEAHQAATGAALEAAKMVVDAEEAATQEKNACFCRVQAANNKANEALNTANSAANQKAWIKAHHMLCILNDTQKCIVPPWPKVKPAELAAGVNSAQCVDVAKGSNKGKKKGFVAVTSGPNPKETKQGGANPPGVTFHQHCINDPSRSTGGKITAYKSYGSLPKGWMSGTSTVTMTQGWEVRVFDQKDWKGNHKTFGNCNSNSATKLYDFCREKKSGGGTWNDRMRSFMISKCS